MAPPEGKKTGDGQEVPPDGPGTSDLVVTLPGDDLRSRRRRRSSSRTRSRKTTPEDSDRSLQRRRKRSENRMGRGRRARSRTSSSDTSSAFPRTQSDEESTETDSSFSKRNSKRNRRRRKAKPNLYDVLKGHEGLLKHLTAEIRELKANKVSDTIRVEELVNRRTEELANSLSRTTLKKAIEEERGKERRSTEVEHLEAPRLNSSDCKQQIYNKALQAFHSSFRTLVNGKERPLRQGTIPTRHNHGRGELLLQAPVLPAVQIPCSTRLGPWGLCPGVY